MPIDGEWPYDLPIFRRSFRAESPNGDTVAEMPSASEVSMSNPTSGTLHLSTGLTIRNCNPSFIWSEDSRYLAVPEWSMRAGLFRGQRLLVVEPATGRIFASPWMWGFLQPESFARGDIVVVRHPERRHPRRISWRIPDGLAGFTRRSLPADSARVRAT
jgi:hypothetical protein